MATPSPLSALLVLVTVCSFIATVSAADAANQGSIHDLLRAHGLPGGLFPRSVESYCLEPATGQLEVRLEQPCYVKYDGLAYFDRVVRGNLSYGELGGVVGLSQEELFLWFPVKGIMVTDPSSGVILFDIGLAHKQLSLSLFESPPECHPNEGGFLGSVVDVAEACKFCQTDQNYLFCKGFREGNLVSSSSTENKKEEEQLSK